MKIKKARGSQKGVAILTATVILIIIAGMAAAFLMLSFNQSKFITEASESEATLQICEAGVEDAINKLQAYATAWAVAKATPTLGSTYDFMALNFTCTASVDKLTVTGSLNGGTWSAIIYNNKTYKKAVDPTAPTWTGQFFPTPFSYDYPAFTDPIWFVIIASGTHGKQNRTLQVMTSAFDQSSIFKYGLFGDVQVDALGTFHSDGYNSSAGSYASQATNIGPGGPYAHATGSIGSNGNIIVNGSADIMGSATPGPGGTISGGGYVSGSTTPATAVETLTMPNVTTTTPITPGWTSGNKTLGTAAPPAVNPLGQTGTAVAGAGSPTVVHWSDMNPSGPGTLKILQDTDIYIDGSIGMNNNQNFVIGQDTSGKAYTVRVYQNGGSPPTNGDITFNGQAIAGNGTAKNFQVYSTTTGTVKFNGGSTVFAAVNAPKSYFKNNGGNQFFGAMVAASMLLSGTASFHYDEDLASLSMPEPKFKIVSWRETAHLDKK